MCGRYYYADKTAEDVEEELGLPEGVLTLPAGGFYEWSRDKTKYNFTKGDNSPLYLAGFYNMNENRDSFVILTTEANSSMEPVHDRMPVFIEGKNVRKYLSNRDAALDMIRDRMSELNRKSDYEQLNLF